MAEWHHWLNGHGSEWTPGVGNGQGELACCDSWGHKESDMTERLNWTELNWTEAEDIKKRWQEHTEELYKKDLHDPDNQEGVITTLEPDFLECEVKWVLGSMTMNKASGGNGIPVELFQILKDDAVQEPEIKLSTSLGSWKTQESSRKIFTSALLTMTKLLTVWITTNSGKFFKRGKYLTCLLRNLYAGQEATVRTGHGTTD